MLRRSWLLAGSGVSATTLRTLLGGVWLVGAVEICRLVAGFRFVIFDVVGGVMREMRWHFCRRGPAGVTVVLLVVAMVSSSPKSPNRLETSFNLA